MLTFADALAIVKRQAQTTVPPAVGDPDVTDILNKAVRYTPWAAGHTYAFGDRVAPLSPTSAGMGHLFRCVQGGVSGAAEPPWVAQPLYSTLSGAYASRPYGRASPVASGFYLPDGTAIWQEDGPAPSEMYDVRAATYAVILEKMALVSGDYQFRIGGRDGVEESPQQVIDNLERLAKRYAPFGL